jgi:NAD dependent epimerase/dehydratase family enzyme
MHDVGAMQAFIAGATGVLGRRVVQRLVSRGHHVVALARSDANEAPIRELGARTPRSIPRFVAKAVIGAHLIDSATASVRVSNKKGRERLGFAPQYPTLREGYRRELAVWQESLSSYAQR